MQSESIKNGIMKGTGCSYFMLLRRIHMYATFRHRETLLERRRERYHERRRLNGKHSHFRVVKKSKEIPGTPVRTKYVMDIYC